MINKNWCLYGLNPQTPKVVKKIGSLLIEGVSGSPSILFKSLGSVNKLYGCLNDGSVDNCVELLVTVK